MTKIEQYKGILKILDISGLDAADMFGIKYASYRTMTAGGNKVTPKWVTAFVEGYTLAHDKELMCIECEIRESGHGQAFLFCEECLKDD